DLEESGALRRTGRMFQNLVAIERGDERVLAPGGILVKRMRGGRDALRRRGLELIGVREDVGELLREQLDFVLRELEARERRDLAHVGVAQSIGHGDKDAKPDSFRRPTIRASMAGRPSSS